MTTDLGDEEGEALRKHPAIQHDAALIVSLLRDLPNAGNHFLFAQFKDAGGFAPWKSFRRALAIMREGGDPKSTIEDKAAKQARRKRQMQERAEAKKIRAQEAERKKEEESMATIRREDLTRGQEVWVKSASDPTGNQRKRKSAKVLEVARAAVRVQINGDPRPTLLRFNEIALEAEDTPEDQSLSVVPAAFAALAGRGHQVEPRQHPHVEVRRPQQVAAEPPAPPAAPPPTPPATASGALDQVNAWVEQASTMRDGLVKQQAQLQVEMDDLALEALKIEEALAVKRTEQARLTALLAALDQVRAAAA